MKRQQPDVRQFDSSRHSFGHGIWYVVKFQIEENLGAGVREHLNRPRTFGRKELATDFEEPDRSAKTSHQSGGSPEAVKVQGNDQSS
jgi:hypothetical protein